MNFFFKFHLQPSIILDCRVSSFYLLLLSNILPVLMKLIDYANFSGGYWKFFCSFCRVSEQSHSSNLEYAGKHSHIGIWGQPFSYCKIIWGFSDKQHSYMSARSIVTNLAIISYETVECVDDHGPLNAVYMDFSFAFDRVEYNLFLEKVSSFGFSPSLAKLIRIRICLSASEIHSRTIIIYPFC